MNKKPINRNNPKNIYCDHCKHYKAGAEKDRYGYPVKNCGNPDSKHYHRARQYWHRCKAFEWED